MNARQPVIQHIYCDESCHLEADHQKVMVLGGLTCPAHIRKAVARDIKALKRKHGFPPHREIKWTQVSPSQQDFYLALVDLFFDRAELAFRTVVVPNKAKLDHSRFNQSHDDFYYKMWWQLLRSLVGKVDRSRIFLDIKDTQSADKVRKLHEVLRNTHYDFDSERILSIETVHSHDVPLLQLSDLLIGAISHFHRDLKGSAAKQAVMNRIQARSGLPNLKRSTPPAAQKFNIFVWKPQEAA